jgi:hypothetical protein
MLGKTPVQPQPALWPRPDPAFQAVIDLPRHYRYVRLPVACVGQGSGASAISRKRAAPMCCTYPGMTGRWNPKAAAPQMREAGARAVRPFGKYRHIHAHGAPAQPLDDIVHSGTRLSFAANALSALQQSIHHCVRWRSPHAYRAAPGGAWTNALFERRNPARQSAFHAFP